MKRKILLFLIIVLLASCSKFGENGNEKYIEEINQWHKKREAGLKEVKGWLNLSGLYWLEEGENSFGSSPDNDLIFPKGKINDHAGKFILDKGKVSVKIDPDITVLNNGKMISEMELKPDDEDSSALRHASLVWFVIKRGDRFGIRLRDLKHHNLFTFNGIERYPVNINWRIEAKFIPSSGEKKISVPNILGNTEEEKFPGNLSFEIDGVQYSLEVLEGDSDNYFLIFADLTNGDDTYRGGRFLSVPKPDSSRETYIDFNKAYNPPCVFSEFATCPLPPMQNHLQVEITAGEKNYGEGY
ncbi:MAG: DUF1684 domain-containing protein [Melioribacteraceae bacterium]|nr:DUF1684 domain-containing protein [Melioribacteraceae bacterium]